MSPEQSSRMIYRRIDAKLTELVSLSTYLATGCHSGDHGKVAKTGELEEKFWKLWPQVRDELNLIHSAVTESCPPTNKTSG